MDEHANVVDRADSLMRRRRSFIAAPAKQTESFAAPLPANEDEDLPVLTEVVFAEAAISEAPPEHIDETLLSIIASDLVHSLEQQLAIELPTLLEATLFNAQNELRAGINSTLELALRDFLAHRRQLRLPLDEPNRDV